MGSTVPNCRAWLMAIACSWIAFCNTGIYRSSSVLYVEMIKVLNVSRETASWPFSLFGAMSSFVGILPGLLSEYFTVHQFVMFGAFLSTAGVILCYFAEDVIMVTICFGIVSGFGSGLIMTLLPLTLNRKFSTYRATANGIFLSGATASLLVLPPLTEWLIDNFALRGTYLLLGGLVLNVFVGAFLARVSGDPEVRTRNCCCCQSQTNNDSDNSKCMANLLQKQISDKNNSNWMSDMTFKCLRSLRDPMFVLITFCSVTTRTVVVTFTLVLVDYLMDKGETEMQGVILVSLVAIPELVGRLGSGWISDRGYMKRKHVFLVAEIVSGMALFLLTLVKSRVYLFAFSALFALANGGAFILVNVFYLEYLGMERLPVALGLKNAFTGMASLCRPWLIGVFRDNNVQSYDYLFYTLGTVSISAGALWFLEPLIVNGRKEPELVQEKNLV